MNTRVENTKRVELVTEILAYGRIKKWKEYGEEYGEHPEKIRKWWRYFSEEGVKNGMLTPYDKMSDLQIERAYDLGLLEEDDKLSLLDANMLKASLNENLPSAWDLENSRYLTIEEYCDRYGLDFSTVKRSKLVGHNPNHMVYNIEFIPSVKNLDVSDTDIEDIVKKVNVSVDSSKPKFVETEWFDRLVYTDVHINMNPDGFSGSPLYESTWDEKEVMKRLGIMVEFAIENKRSDYLVVSDLGDFLDGFRGETVRGGHKLPQNTNDKEAFNLGLEFKIKLVTELLKEYEYIYSTNCVNNNHAGDFDYFVNKAAKETLEKMFPNRVEVHNRTRFIEHYSIGKHTFVETHGKDAESLKFGFKPIPDSKQIEKIDQYCKEYGLYNGNFIEFSKGDSHLNIFDLATSNDFTYFSYPAFSPPSQWVKVNFKNSKSGFYFFNIEKNGQRKIFHPYFFI